MQRRDFLTTSLTASVAATLGVEVLLRFSTWGKAVRAVADDLEAAEIVGVNSQYINIGAFALAGGLAGTISVGSTGRGTTGIAIASRTVCCSGRFTGCATVGWGRTDDARF